MAHAPERHRRYRAVLRALAAERGLTGVLDETSPLVELDEHGVLLWYLSERLDQLETAVPSTRLTRETVRQTIREVLAQTGAHSDALAEVADTAAKWLAHPASRGKAIQALALMASAQPSMPASAAGLLDGAAPGGWSWSRLSDRVRLIALAARGLSIAAGVAAVGSIGPDSRGRTFPGVSDESHAALEWFTLVGMAAGPFREQIALEAVAGEGHGERSAESCAPSISHRTCWRRSSAKTFLSGIYVVMRSGFRPVVDVADIRLDDQRVEGCPASRSRLSSRRGHSAGCARRHVFLALEAERTAGRRAYLSVVAPL